MADYAFETTWRFRAPIAWVYEAIRDYQAWPTWWPSIASATRVQAGAADGLGETVRLVFRTRLPYTLAFDIRTTFIEEPTALDGEANGELAGTGRWRLTAEGPDETLVKYYWDVRTTKWWMNLLAPLARPAFHWNHDQVMESGRVGLARLLAARATREGAPTRG